MNPFLLLNERKEKRTIMIDTRDDLFNSTIRCLLSDKDEEIINFLYKVSVSTGDFKRRFILKVDEKEYFILNENGIKERISSEQVEKIYETAKEGKFFSGSTICSLFPVEDLRDKTKICGYWIIDRKKGLEVERISPIISALFTKLLSLNFNYERDYFSALNDFINDFDKFSGECETLYYLNLITPHLNKIVSFNQIIFGISSNKNSFEVAIGRDGKNFSVGLKNVDFTLFFGSRVTEYSSATTTTFNEISNLFGLKFDKYLISSYKMKENSLEIFLLLSSNQKPTEESLFVIDVILTLLSSLRDVIKVKEKEKYLSECLNLIVKQAELKDRILNSIKYGVMAISGKGEIQFINTECENLLNLTKVELREKILFQSKEPGKSILALISRINEEKKEQMVTLNILGRKIDVELSEIKENFFLIFCRDSTILQKEIEERKQLFATISHEIKNPLSVLLSASEILYSERAGRFTTPQQKMVAEMMYTNAKSMAKTLEDISVYNRTLLRGEKEFEDVLLKKSIDDLLEEKQNSIRAKELKVIKRVEDLTIFSNRAMVDTLFSNIIGNAIKYSSYRGNIGIKLQKMGDKVIFEVIDDGVGIPENDIKRIGEPFFRAENVKESIPGTGFGLTIVKNIIERLNGSFKIISPISDEDKLFIGSSDSGKCGTKVTIIFSVGG